MVHGAWRSLVAHYLGVVGVGSSNLLAPTKRDLEKSRSHLFIFGKGSSLLVPCPNRVQNPSPDGCIKARLRADGNRVDIQGKALHLWKALPNILLTGAAASSWPASLGCKRIRHSTLGMPLPCELRNSIKQDPPMSRRIPLKLSYQDSQPDTLNDLEHGPESGFLKRMKAVAVTACRSGGFESSVQTPAL
jgi:hypothetical protein